MIIKNRGQVAIESIILFAIFVVFFLSIWHYSSKIDSMVLSGSKAVRAKDLCDNVGWSINQVYQGGEGTSSFVYLPQTLEGDTEYELAIYPGLRFIEIRWPGRSYRTILLATDISASAELHPGRLNISNKGGILLEQ